MLFKTQTNCFSILIPILLTGLFFLSCNKQTAPKPLEEILKGSINTQVNPHKNAPLTALLSLSTLENSTIEIEIEGDIPVRRTYAGLKKFHELPVLGLYPDTTNTLKIRISTEDQDVYEGNIEVKTAPLPDFFPTISIEKLDRTKMEPGFHMIDMLIANNGKFLTYTLMFDDNGKIRWFMDMSIFSQIAFTPYRLKNGNWLYFSWIDILEVTDLGEIVKQEKMWGNAGTHFVQELPNGNLLMGGSKKDAKVIREGREILTRNDFVLEWNRTGKGKTVKEWDLRQVLDISRSVYPADFSLDVEADWFHLNSVARSEKDNSLVISGRNQGVLKVDNDNQLKWILAPHKSWGKSGFDGKGFETSPYLLTAIDENGNPFNNAVQEGTEGTETFEWSTGQHALTVLENGNLLLFDNGLMRNFSSSPTYSRAVEYKIDEENKTIQQVWQYGKEGGLDMYSPITSDVDVLPQTGNRMITLGTVRKGKLPPHAQMIELSFPDNQEVFKANIFFKDALGTGEQVWAQFDLVFKGERYPLIP